MESHEYDLLKKEEREERENEEFEEFKTHAVGVVADCLQINGDLIETLSDLDFEYDEYVSMSNQEMNSIVIEAVGLLKERMS